MGYFVSRAARAHRQLRGAPAAASRTRMPTTPRQRSPASRSTTCAKTCAISTSTWTSECAVVRRALRHRARRLAHHRHRSAARSRIRARGDQHRAQPGLAPTSASPRPRRTRRSCSRGAPWRSKPCNAQAEVEPLARARRRSSRDLQATRARSARRLPPQRAARRCFEKAQHRSFVEDEQMNFLIAFAVTFIGLLHRRADPLRHRPRCSASTPSSQERPLPRLCALRQGARRAR